MNMLEPHIRNEENLKKEKLRLAQKSKFKRIVVLTTMVCVLFIVALAMMWIRGNHYASADFNERIEEYDQKVTELINQVAEKDKQIQELASAPMVVNPVSPEIILDAIHAEINELGELATVEYLFTDSAKFSDSKYIKDWNIPLTEKSFILKWDGVIKAGVELNKVLFEIDENETSKKIIVSIPNAEILSYEIDTESVEVLDEKDNLFNNITLDDKIKFDAATEKAMKERAIENGLLNKASKNAEVIISRFLLSNPALADGYEIEFASLDEK